MIVITTMDALPDYCRDCPCNNGEHSICEADKEKRSTFEYRPYWCPLKEVSSDAYENGFNDAMLGKQELMYEGTDGKWHKKDW